MELDFGVQVGRSEMIKIVIFLKNWWFLLLEWPIWSYPAGKLT